MNSFYCEILNRGGLLKLRIKMVSILAKQEVEVVHRQQPSVGLT